MTDEDPSANNLFSRLISYTPRCGEGGGSRTALEDYYTEALSWCLRNSQEFRKSFFAILGKHLNAKTEFKLPSQDDVVAIDTQLSFDAESDEDSENGETSRRRRFDLVIRSENSDGFVIVLEDKVKWAFTYNQIPAYLKELKNGRFKEYRIKILVILSPFGQKPGITENTIPLIPLGWGEVQEALGEIPQSAGQKCENFICGQFADFLKRRGLSAMKIDKLNPEEMNLNVFFTFYAASLKILEQFRENQKDLWKPKNIGHGYNSEDHFFWWGFYSKVGIEDWCGFCFYYNKTPPELRMQVEGKFKKGTEWNEVDSSLGNTLKKASHNAIDASDGTYILLYEPINATFNGKAAAIYEWLSSAAQEFKDLRNAFGSSS